jgi:anti-sigma regulatory factor (Ser/Thr protein kinase)
MQACAAGQFSPLRLRAGQCEEIELPRQLALGIASGTTFSSTRLPLAAGDLWLLFSDGVTEARDPAGNEYTTSRLAASVPAGAGPQEAIDAVAVSLCQFTAKAGSHDDATLIAAQWRGAPPPASWTIEARPEDLKTARGLIERWAHFVGFPEADVGCMVLGADEAAANIIRHAYCGEKGSIDYAVGLEEGGDTLVIRMRDHGKPVSPECLKGRELADVKPGGLGLHFMRCTFDEVRFESHPDGTTLHLRKRLHRA